MRLQIQPNLKLNNFNLQFKKISKITKILICGIAFKGTPSTSDVRGSLATGMIKQIKKLYNDPKIDILDKYVSKDDATKVSKNSKFLKNFSRIKEKYQIILILNNNHYWKDIGYKKFSKKLVDRGIIYDFWSSFKKDEYKKNYFRFGGGDL